MKIKTFIIISILLFPHFANSQIPEDYYDGTGDLSGEELKTALYNIIKVHTVTHIQALQQMYEIF